MRSANLQSKSKLPLPLKFGQGRVSGSQGFPTKFSRGGDLAEAEVTQMLLGLTTAYITQHATSCNPTPASAELIFYSTPFPPEVSHQ